MSDYDGPGGLTRSALLEQIEAAKIGVARSALATPGIYHEAVELLGARKAFREAKERLARAEAAWAALIAPAKGWAPDPLAASKEGGAA